MSDFRKHLEKQMQNPSFASEYGKPSKTREQRKLSTATKIKAAYIGAIVLWFIVLAQAVRVSVAR